MAERKRWPNHAENKRQESQALADEASALIHEATALLTQGRTLEARAKLAEARALNERIGRLMSEARQP